MEEPKPKNHPKESFVYAVSFAFERASFYGVRAIIFFYLMESSFEMNLVDATQVFVYFTTSIYFGKIIGGLVGDFAFGNKRTIVIGAFLQTAGCFALCYEEAVGLFVGLGLISLGSGLYTPNIRAHVGKMYLSKPKIIDAGFSILYSGANIGSFFGGLVIALVAFDTPITGFVLAGVLMTISAILPLFIKESEAETVTHRDEKTGSRVAYVAIAVLVSVLFGYIYEFSYYGVFDVHMNLDTSDLFTFEPLRTLETAVTMCFGIIACFAWTYYFYDQLSKIIVGFFLATMGIIILLFIPEPFNTGTLIIAIISIILVSAAEIHINQVISSIITKKINSKYLAIAFSVLSIPGLLLTMYVLPELPGMELTTSGFLVLGSAAFALIGTLLLIYRKYA